MIFMILGLTIFLQPLKKCYQVATKVDCKAVFCYIETEDGSITMMKKDMKVGDVTSIEKPCNPIFIEKEEPEK